MANETNIKEELIKQMNKNSNKTPDANRNSIQQILARDKTRVRRIKKVTIFTWLLFIMSFIAAGIIEALPGPHPDWFPPTAVILVQGLLIIAVIFTVSLYVRERTLTMHQIQARLANIEEQLKKMSQDK